jgi:DNA polymerase (family 10)
MINGFADVILMTNISPYRLDLRDHHIRLAKERGVKTIVNTDAHQKDQLHLIRFGIAQARRGWAEKKDAINTGNVSKLLKKMKDRS